MSKRLLAEPWSFRGRRPGVKTVGLPRSRGSRGTDRAATSCAAAPTRLLVLDGGHHTPERGEQFERIVYLLRNLLRLVPVEFLASQP